MSKNRTRHFIFFIFFIVVISCQKKEEVSLSEMALIPEGEFIMGSNEGEVDEAPERKIYLKSFLIDKYVVSNEQYKRFVSATNRPEPKNWFFTGYEAKLKDYPVSFVDFNNARAYCSWLGKRLPSEKEWEKAARGTDGRKYPWGNHFDKSKTNTSLGGIMGTVPVDSYSSGQSPYGVFNMAGNVWEWTNTRGKTDEKMIVKGGSWGLSHRFSRAFSRVEYEAKARVNNLGFRCALDK